YSTAQSEVTGPKTESGPERGSLTVQCNYTSKWKTHRKYWCRGAQWSSCAILVSTTESEQEVKKDRVSIRDDQEKLTFMVTMVDLRREDTGFYWCAIERTGIDYRFQVNVNVDPAPTTVSTTVPTTNTYAAPDPTENTDSLPTLTSYYSNSRHPFTELSTLLPLIFAVLLLLLMAASLLAWRIVKRQKKGCPGDSSLRSLSQVLQPLEEDLCYANLSLQQPRSSPGSSRKKASTKTSAQADQAEVEYVTMAPFPREEISYASLSLDVSDQEPTYSNTGHLPSRDQKEPTEYSSIRRP
ncbi:CMRF35-like molecule 1, partial [Sciurus carolinensis]|nr:CMRF35-like molecule 1 [Sciurus carolinensis]